jgi:hypothetical protein
MEILKNKVAPRRCYTACLEGLQVIDVNLLISKSGDSVQRMANGTLIAV